MSIARAKGKLRGKQPKLSKKTTERAWPHACNRRIFQPDGENAFARASDGGDQPDIMTVPRHFSRPLVRAGASLHRNLARRLPRHEPRELRPRQLLAEHDRPVRCSAVHLEHVLCQIDADDGNRFRGCRRFHLCIQHGKCGTLRCRLGRAASTRSLVCTILILLYIHTVRRTNRCKRN